MIKSNWDNKIWKIIDTYFKSTDNYLTKNQIDSYNTFLEKNIPKTIRQFNPISMQFGSSVEIDSLLDVELDAHLTKYSLSTDGNPTEKRIRLQEEYDRDIEKYRHEINIYVGATPVWNSDKSKIIDINDNAQGIYMGKAIIQETKDEGDAKKILRKTLYPNEARLKNLTYRSELRVDLIVEKIINNYRDHHKYTNINSELLQSEEELEKTFASPEAVDYSNKGRRNRCILHFQHENRNISFYPNISLGNIPIMLRSRKCSLNTLKNISLTKVGECRHDQGGYFIIDGKEKVIVAQERDINNKIYANFKNDQINKVIANIRSAAENKFIPARITRVCILHERVDRQRITFDNTIRVKIPLIDKEIPLFILFRALGFYSDQEIVEVICNENSGLTEQTYSKYFSKMLEILTPSINESSYIINNQKDALDFLMEQINENFMRDAPKTYNMKHKCLMEILKNHFLPHCGQGLLEKGHFLGFMVQKAIHVLLGIEPETDRDNYMYKRIDISGYLLSQIFRDLYFRVKNKLLEVVRVGYSKKFGSINTENITNEDFYKLIDNNLYNNSLVPTQLLDRSIINDGMLYAFKNCWGLKDAPCKAGVVQDITRISYIGFVSHLRRINTPLSKSAKVRAPHSLHGSSWGIMCPSETPDGGNIGIRKNLAITALITPGTSSFLLDRLIYSLGVIDIKTQRDRNIRNLPKTRVFLNERIMGYNATPAYFFTVFKLLKRNGYINIYTSISWDKQNHIISISTDSGRGIRPVFIVEKGNVINLTDNIMSQIEHQEGLTWTQLLVGLNNEIMQSDTDDKCYVTDDLLNMGKDGPDGHLVQYLRNMGGIIEYIDTNESNTSLIALNPADLKSTINKYDYCEISPTLILSILATLIPGLSMNQAPRNQFSASQGKQALGLYASNYRNRMDIKGQILHYPQKPIVKSKFSKYLFTDELPHGINAIVAIGCFSGYNQEDSIILNKDAIQRGLFRSTKFRTYVERDTMDNGKIIEKICNPTYFPNVKNMHSGDYSKLGDNGVIRMDENLKVSENDILVGKCVISDEKDADGNDILYDNSDYVRRGEDGYVDRVFINEGNEGQKYCKIRIRKDKDPELGDKFASRHGQKGTIGMVLPAKDMPRTKDGIVPDILVNTHAFPSRMTIAQFLELLLGKVCAINGFESEIAPFTQMLEEGGDSESIIDKTRNILEKLKYEKNGNEIMYSGITGEMLKVNFFIGPTFYQRLTHQVSDKQQSRSKGSNTALARQPVSGRAAGGGGRIGEMERDAILSHGAADFLKESFMERSDKYQFWISCKTGLISAVNPKRNIYKDLAGDAMKQSISLLSRLQESTNDIEKKQTETSKSEFVCVQAPYAFKLLIQEMEAIGIAPRLVSDRTLRKWKSIALKNNGLVILTESDKHLLEYTQRGEIITNSLSKYHNEIKRSLLLHTASNIRSGYTHYPDYKSMDEKTQMALDDYWTTRASSLIDFSVGVGGDLHKWYSADYKIILGIDISSENIERSSSDSTEGSYYADKEGALKRLDNLRNGIKTNSRQREWARKSKIEFIVGDSSKLLNLEDAPIDAFISQGAINQKTRSFDLVDPKYSQQLQTFLTRYIPLNEYSSINMKQLKFGTAVMFFSIHYLFDRQERLRNFFTNCSKTLKLGGYIVVTTFDGCRVLEKLLQNKGVYQYEGEWSIKSHSALSALTSSFENGFGKKITVFVDSIGTENTEFLVNPALLITFAKMMGFTLENSPGSSKFEYPTDTFDNILHHSKAKAALEKNPPMKAFSDLNRYFVFKKTAELENLINPDIGVVDMKQIDEFPKVELQSAFAYYPISVPGSQFKKKVYRSNLLPTADEVTHLNYSIYIANPDYRNIIAPFHICANLRQINNLIDVPRYYIKDHKWLNSVGPLREINNIYEDNNCYSIPESFRDILEQKRDLSIYQNIDNTSLENTLEYIYSNIKVGIYVQISNEVLYNFTPIINYNEHKFTNEILTRIQSSETESGLTNVLIELDAFDNLIYTPGVNSRTDALNHTIFIKSMNHTCYSVLVGSDVLSHLIPHYYIYKDMIEQLLIHSRSDSPQRIRVNDNECIINVLEMPIVKIINTVQSEEVVHPVFGQRHLGGGVNDNYGIEGDGLALEQKMIPILSAYHGRVSGETITFGDIPIPDIHSYIIAKNIQQSEISFIDTYVVGRTGHKLVTFVNTVGPEEHNVRALVGTRREFFKELFAQGPALEIIDVANGFEKNNLVMMEKGLLAEPELQKEYEFKSRKTLASANGFGVFSTITANAIVYIDAFGSDHLLTYSLAYRKPIIMLKDFTHPFQLWYEHLFVPYDFAFGADNSKANIFIIDTGVIRMRVDSAQESDGVVGTGSDDKLLKALSVEIGLCSQVLNEEHERYISTNTGDSIRARELRESRKQYSLLGGVLTNSQQLSSLIFGGILHANDTASENSNCNTIYQYLATSLNSVSFNFTGEKPVIKSKEQVGEYISERLLVKSSRLANLEATTLNSRICTYEIGKSISIKGLMYTYITFSAKHDVFEFIRAKLVESYRETANPDGTSDPTLQEETDDDSPPYVVSPEGDSSDDDSPPYVVSP